MSNSTTNTYQMKREILNYSKKLSQDSPRDKQKACADMIYGLLAAKSCVLSEIAHELHQSAKRIQSTGYPGNFPKELTSISCSIITALSRSVFRKLLWCLWTIPTLLNPMERNLRISVSCAMVHPKKRNGKKAIMLPK